MIYYTLDYLSFGLVASSCIPREQSYREIVSGMELWQCYINVAIKIVCSIHRPVFYLKHNLSETGFYLSSGRTYSIVPNRQRRRHNSNSKRLYFKYKIGRWIISKILRDIVYARHDGNSRSFRNNTIFLDILRFTKPKKSPIVNTMIDFHILCCW
jgi:hypothetical protein